MTVKLQMKLFFVQKKCLFPAPCFVQDLIQKIFQKDLLAWICQMKQIDI